MKIHVQACLWSLVFIFLGFTPWRGIAGNLQLYKKLFPVFFFKLYSFTFYIYRYDLLSIRFCASCEVKTKVFFPYRQAAVSVLFLEKTFLSCRVSSMPGRSFCHPVSQRRKQPPRALIPWTKHPSASPDPVSEAPSQVQTCRAASVSWREGNRLPRGSSHSQHTGGPTLRSPAPRLK